MESSSKNTTVRNRLLTEENSNLSAFRRRNRILILTLLSLIIALTVIICALIAFFVRSNTDRDSTNPAVGAFCEVSKDTPSCLRSLDTIVSPKSRTDPNQIFTLSLSKAAEELRETIALASNELYGKAANCSAALRAGMSRIGEAAAAMRADPFVEMQSEEQRTEMMKLIGEAEEELRSCLGDLDQAAESTAVSAATEKVLRAREYVSNGGGFVRAYAGVMQVFRSRIYAAEVGGRNMLVQNLRVLCVGAPMWLFVLVLFLALFRVR